MLEWPAAGAILIDWDGQLVFGKLADMSGVAAIHATGAENDRTYHIDQLQVERALTRGEVVDGDDCGSAGELRAVEAPG